MRTSLSAFLLASVVGLTSGCVDAGVEDDLGTTSRPQIMLNQIMLNQIMLNALTGIPEYLQLLVNSPLSTATFEGPLGDALADADARALMPYLVSCALLETSAPVVWDDPWGTSGSHRWQGGAGLCPEWEHGAPSPVCLELVSACLLARENAEGISVATSQRGQYADGKAFGLEGRIHPKTSSGSGDLLASFVPCALTTPGANRNCGWVPSQSWVGSCSAGKKVTLSCTSGEQTAVRICDGVNACNSADAIGAIHEVCTKSGLTFVCPGSGTYSAMAGPRVASPTSGGAFQVELAASSGVFPTSELRAFGVREGNFYGSLFEGFDTDAIEIEVDTSGAVPIVRKKLIGAMPASVYPKASVCADYAWTTPDAYMAHRLCAQLDFDNVTANGCVAEYRGRCNQVKTNSPANRCASVDGGPVLGDGDFDGCEGDVGEVWENGVTVFLNRPCDLLPPALGSLCTRL